MLNAQRPRTETNTNTLRTWQQMRKIYTWYRIDWERLHSRVCVWEGRENSQGKTENISNSLSAVRQTWRTVQLMRKMYYVMECKRIYTGYSMDLERPFQSECVTLWEGKGKLTGKSIRTAWKHYKYIISSQTDMKNRGYRPFSRQRSSTFSGVT